MTVVYYPTDDMISDVLTKPLQGSKFRKFRKLMLNLKEDDATLEAGMASQECVTNPVRITKVPNDVSTENEEKRKKRKPTKG